MTGLCALPTLASSYPSPSPSRDLAVTVAASLPDSKSHLNTNYIPKFKQPHHRFLTALQGINLTRALNLTLAPAEACNLALTQPNVDSNPNYSTL